MPLPVKNHTPEDYARFINGRTRLNNIRSRERDQKMMRLSELLGDPAWDGATDEQLAAELGVTRWSVVQYKLVLIERGRCKTCGQLKPAVAHLEKSQLAPPPPPK